MKNAAPRTIGPAARRRNRSDQPLALNARTCSLKRSATFSSSACAASCLAVLRSQLRYSSIAILKPSMVFFAAIISSFEADLPSGIEVGAAGRSQAIAGSEQATQSTANETYFFISHSKLSNPHGRRFTVTECSAPVSAGHVPGLARADQNSFQTESSVPDAALRAAGASADS